MTGLKIDEPDLPTTWKSEQEIAEKAPLALNYLKRKNALDLSEILGLSHA
jgi:hypothetical protein